jgi:surface antigen
VFAAARVLLSTITLLLAGLVVVPGAASAVPETTRTGTTTLCVGYTGCANAGKGNGGYRTENDKMWWRMYSGHNCTNYAAYRMVKSGLPNTRPWSGGGNAEYWGTSMRSIRDDKPAVGAVAWWAAYDPPAGSSGHVAYVERVVSDSEIIVSQDSWGGDFSWARITRSSGRWPTGFVHFNDVGLTNTALPAVSGTPRVGSTLTTAGATWKPAGATVTYQWRADGLDIAGATSPTLLLALAQQDKRISVVATATELGYPTSKVESAETEVVAPGVITNTVAPAIVGEPQVDATLTATPGSWSPTPSRLVYQWFADGAAVPDATTPTLVPVPELVGKNLTVRVTARKVGYDAVRTTALASAPVAPGTFSVVREPLVTGTALPGETLSLDPGSYSPAEGAEVAVRWLREGVPVDGASGTTYLLTNADLGARVTAQVSLTRPGYTPLDARSVSTARVRSLPLLHVDVVRGTRRVRVAVTVTAPGVDPVIGALRVTRGRTLVDERPLRGGATTVLLPELRPGLHTITIRYLGSSTVQRAVLRREIRFP